MDLGDALGVVGLLLYWRVVLCLVISSLAAFLLFRLFPWFSGLQAIVLAALGLLPGLIWEEAARPSSGSSAAPPTSTVVAALSAAIAGAIWGALSSTSLHSALAGAVVLAGGVWGWFCLAVASRGWLSREQGSVCMLVAAVTYPITALIAHNAF